MQSEGSQPEVTKRFINAAAHKFLKGEMQRISEILPSQNQEKNNHGKGPSEAALILRDFADGVILVFERLLEAFPEEETSFFISKQIFDFFHLEDQMRPFARANEPYEIKRALLRLFTYCYAWSSWKVGRGSKDTGDLQALRTKLQLRIGRIISALKIHEDIILIEVSDIRVNKFEGEILIPLIEHLSTNFLSYPLLSFLENICADYELTETQKLVARIQHRARELINKGSTPVSIKHQSRTEKYTQAVDRVKFEEKIEEDERAMKIEENENCRPQMKIEDETGQHVKTIQSHPLDMILSKSIKKQQPGAIKDQRRAMFFDKFIKGHLEAKTTMPVHVKKEEKAYNDYPSLNQKMATTLVKKNRTKKILEMSNLNTDKTTSRRKLTTPFNSKLVYLPKKSSKAILPHLMVPAKAKPNILYDLQNPHPTSPLVTPPTSPLQVCSPIGRPLEGKDKLSPKLIERSTSLSAAKSPNRALPEAIIDCESDNENSLTFDDWTRNIVAFSTPNKEARNGRNLTEQANKILMFGEGC